MSHNTLTRTPDLTANTPHFRVFANAYPQARYPHREQVTVRNKHEDTVDITINQRITEKLEPGDVVDFIAADLGEPIRTYHLVSPTDIDPETVVVTEKGGLDVPVEGFDR